jgi:O-antigen/teichoic acid export membrane protein
LIGVIVLVIGLTLLPFLPNLINGKTTINHLEVIYLLFLLNSASSYYFIYKQSIIVANQRQHIISKIHSIFLLVGNIVQITLLVVLENYILYLIVQFVFKILENTYIASKANKLYPFIKEKNNVTLSKNERKEFYVNLYSLFLYKISGVVINGTDNIIISKFGGLNWVGLYSNYLLIVNTLNTFLSYIFYSLTASVGNLNVTENAHRKYQIFRVINFANFWVFGFCTVCLWNLLNPFVVLWLGHQYALSKLIVFTIVLNFYTTGMQNAPTTYRETTGLFKKGKHRPVIATIINLVASIILANEIGIAGVILGTVVSRLCTYFWYDPFVIFKYSFQKSVFPYFARYAFFAILVFVASLMVDVLSSVTNPPYTLNDFVFRGIFCIIVPNLMFFTFFYKTMEVKYLQQVFIKLISKITIKIREKRPYNF